MKGAIRTSRGKYCIIADSDDSYDWSSMGPFIEKLRQGFDVVMGARLRGAIAPGAVPPLHRFFGNPLLSGLTNVFFRTGVSDAYCGMRGFSREAYEKMDLRSSGMEFAIEMVVKANNKRMTITEVPVALRLDGRSRPSHLCSLRDGWRTLRLLLLYAPDYLYVIPGVLLFVIGALLQALLLRGPVLAAGLHIGIHGLAVGCSLSLIGFQILSLGAFAKAFAMNESYEMSGPVFGKLMKWSTLEAGLLVGAVLMWVGLLADIAILVTWLVRGKGPLGSTHAVFVATTAITLGIQIAFSSILLGMFKIGVSGDRGPGETRG